MKKKHKTVTVSALILISTAIGIYFGPRANYIENKQNTYTPPPTTCSDSNLPQTLELQYPFQKDLRLLTIDRFFSWKGNNDLRPQIKEYFDQLYTDNTMTRVSVDIASRGYSDEEAARDFAGWTSETLDTSRTSIMLGILDSFFIEKYTVAKYAERTGLIADAYSGYPASIVYEIGNEVNGEWTGKPDLVMKKIQAADEVMCARNSEYLSSINFHYGSGDILNWIDNNFIPSDVNNLSKRLDFITISYYPEDVEQPPLSKETTTNLVSELAKRFPSAAIGFGEIGYESLENISATQYGNRLNELYSSDGSLSVNHPHFIKGGGIWNIGEAIEHKRTDVLDVIADSAKKQ